MSKKKRKKAGGWRAIAEAAVAKCKELEQQRDAARADRDAARSELAREIRCAEQAINERVESLAQAIEAKYTTAIARAEAEKRDAYASVNRRIEEGVENRLRQVAVLVPNHRRRAG